MSRLRSLQLRRKSVYTPANEMKDGLTGGEPHEVLSMFTVGAFMLLALIAWLVVAPTKRIVRLTIEPTITRYSLSTPAKTSSLLPFCSPASL